MRSTNDRSIQRNGFTLIELMVVLAVITILVTASWPAFRTPMAKNTLRSSAKDLRSELSKARLRSIETGLILHFRYKEGTSEYEIVPQNSEFSDDMWSEAVSDDVETQSPVSSPLDSDEKEEEEVVTGLLAEGVRFVNSNSADAGFETNITEESSDAFASADFPTSGESDFASDADWSEPIVFYPNGRVSQSRIRLEGQDHIQVDLNVRGLTGNVSVSDLKKAETFADEEEF